MPVDPRSRIPPAVLAAVVDADRQHIAPTEIQKGSQVIDKRRVAVGMKPEMLAVEPHVDILIHAVKANLHMPPVLTGMAVAVP
jgi:hypothetical protein